MPDAVLLDLDETLIEEEAAARGAHEATAQRARAETGGALDPAVFVADVRAIAREHWRRSPAHDRCTKIGISSTEGLWCRFEGDEAPVRALREWAPRYRRDTWSAALRAQGVEDVALAESLGEQFADERRARQRVFPDVVETLAGLRERVAVALVTNGARCLQNEKLDASGLRPFFDLVVVSGELGVGKPDPSIFRHALARLDAQAERAAMWGDSLARDVDGARSAGIAAVWVNRLGRPRPAGREDLLEVATVAEAAYEAGL